MKTITKTYRYINASPGEVFSKIDDLGVTGMHMTKSSAMMMGNKLNLEFLTNNQTGPGSTYRWFGKVMGFPMDFTVGVTKWVPGKEKVWETIGEAQLIIYSWYRMSLTLVPQETGTSAELAFSYEKPKGFIRRVLSFLLARLYGRWCLRRMLVDAGKF